MASSTLLTVTVDPGSVMFFLFIMSVVFIVYTAVVMNLSK